MNNKMSVEGLTDSELRSKLAEYGYPVGPVTQTTRKVLVKKLKAIIEKKNAGSRHSLAARFSSDDTDDETGVLVEKKKKPTNRRQTMAAPMLPPPTVVAPVPVAKGSRTPPKKKPPPRASDLSDTGLSDFEPPAKPTPKAESKKLTKTTVKTYSRSDLETGSDSDVAETMARPSKPEKTAKDSGSFLKYRTPEAVDVGFKAPNDSPARSRSVYTTRDDVKSSTPSYRASIAPIKTTKEPENHRRDSGDILANYETPFLSEFTRRLSSQTSFNLPAASSSIVKNSVFRQSSAFSEVKESDSNGHFSSARHSMYPSTSSPRYAGSSIDRNRDIVSRAYKPTSKASKEESKSNHNVISLVLVVVLGLFFAVLAVMYLGLGGKSENFGVLPSDSNVPLCLEETITQKRPGVNCVQKDNVNNVFQLLGKLYPILGQRAISAACKDTGEKAYLADDDVVEIFTREKDVEPRLVREDLGYAQLLIWKNPKWGISLVEIGEDASNFSEIKSLENIAALRSEKKIGIALTNPNLPMQCLIRRKILTIFSVLLIMGFGFMGVIGAYKLITWYMKCKNDTEREVFQLVSEIISKIELNHQNVTSGSPGGTQNDYLAINHVRDNLIPPKDRKKMSALWEKAVKFLDENESRIRREVQKVAGEEFHVWRWLPHNLSTSNASIGPGSAKKSKVWQGQAFETMEGSPNSLSSSPTPCLKMRHMFDSDEKFNPDWEVTIKDAILEKCGEGVKILHIKVDRASNEGCVYLKCNSQDDAGKAYKALHGCWFDGRLVTVKYLRLERYHERFPESVAFVTPLKPSNNKRLSLQGHNWSNPQDTN